MGVLKSVTIDFKQGLFGFCVCAEVHLSERKPEHAKGAAVCLHRPLARCAGQGPETASRQASVAT